MKKNSIYILMLLLLSMQSLSAYAADLRIEKTWVRMPPPVAETAAAYMKLSNDGDTPIVIESIQSDSAEKVEFHHMSMRDGMMNMAKIDVVTIGVGKSLIFKTGADHLMMMGLKKVFQAGDMLTFLLTTKGGSKYKFQVEVRDMRVQRKMHHH